MGKVGHGRKKRTTAWAWRRADEQIAPAMLAMSTNLGSTSRRCALDEDVPAGRVPTCEITVQSVSRRHVCLFERSYRMDVQIWNLPSVRVQSMYLSCGMSAGTHACADGRRQRRHRPATTTAASASSPNAAAKRQWRGGGLFLSNADPSAVILPGRSRSIGIALPRRLMTALSPASRMPWCGRCPPMAGAALLRHYLEVLQDEAALASPRAAAQPVANHIQDLCALRGRGDARCGGTSPAAEVCGRRGCVHSPPTSRATWTATVSVTALARTARR